MQGKIELEIEVARKRALYFRAAFVNMQTFKELLKVLRGLINEFEKELSKSE